MDLLGILIIVSAVGVLLLFWIVVGIRHLKFLLKALDEQWENVMGSLRKRQDLIPNLIETIKIYGVGDDKLVEEIINHRVITAKHSSPDSQKTELERKLGGYIGKVLEMGRENKDLGIDTNFLELRKEIKDYEQNALHQTSKYNDMVEYYNYHRRFPLLRPISSIFGFYHRGVFEL